MSLGSSGTSQDAGSGDDYAIIKNAGILVIQTHEIIEHETNRTEQNIMSSTDVIKTTKKAEIIIAVSHARP